MKKKVLFLFICFLMIPAWVLAQDSLQSTQEIKLQIHFVFKDSSFNTAELKQSFASLQGAMEYINELPQLLANKGYPAASVDSFWQQDNHLHIRLYTGAHYQWLQLHETQQANQYLQQVGYRPGMFTNKIFTVAGYQKMQEQLLNYFENTGHPFATVSLDSIRVVENKIEATLNINPGVEYHIDSIRVHGKASLKNRFLQQYLGIPNNSLYNRQVLNRIDKKIRELPYLQSTQASEVSMYGAGAVIELYLEPKKSSQVNFLLGFLPSSGSDQKLQVTADVNLDLRNLLNAGEALLLKWQQLQPKSPRLNLGFDQPYIFKSPFGFSFFFNLFKKDSNYVQLAAQAGLQYDINHTQSAKLFMQWQTNTLLGGAIDTNAIKFQKKLPDNIDMNAVNAGITYQVYQTDYRFNPRKGNELTLTATVGIKRLKESNDVLSIKDPFFDYAKLYDTLTLKSYQLRLKADAAHYFPVGRQAVIKSAVKSGYYSSPSVFRNDLFQIGGYQILRGFDEESIYASFYTVFTSEYRYLLGQNSYLFGFTDLGFTKTRYQDVNIQNTFIGGGMGISYETKAGLLNLSLALGKRNDVPFNIRSAAKIHFGYINYF